MPILISNLRVPFGRALSGTPEADAILLARKKLRLPAGQVLESRIYKKSLDARKGREPAFVFSVLLSLAGGELAAVRSAADPAVRLYERTALSFPCGNERLAHPIVVAGFGPAGIFASAALAKRGYPVLVLERGGCLAERVGAVERFWREGALDPETNVQFGEGGAGTFSDGKLTTRIHDPRCGYILEELVRHGAPEEILWTAKPHVGTDKLRGVIASLRAEIEAAGGEVRFHAKLDGIRLQNGRLAAVSVNGEELPCEALVLAVGHSARDTFRLLEELGLPLEPKPFSVGVRIEQLQTTIDRGLYGGLAGDPRLPVGEYQLSHRVGERCVYTFCMCPGGFVVPSASETGGVVTNGMSYHARDGKNANAALVVSVGPADYGAHPLDGMRFQERLERAAFAMGGGGCRAPAMTVRQFREGGPFAPSAVEPTYACGVEPGDFDALFPAEVSSMLRLGLDVFDRRLPGFSDGCGILTGPETRTSSPVRVPRDGETLQSPGAAGLYPCGEGAGYAGGIVSAAADGLRAAERIMARYAAS